MQQHLVVFLSLSTPRSPRRPSVRASRVPSASSPALLTVLVVVAQGQLLPIRQL